MKEKREVPRDEKLLAPVFYRVCCLKDGKIRRGGCNYRKKIPYYEGTVRDARDRVFFLPSRENAIKRRFKKERWIM